MKKIILFLSVLITLTAQSQTEVYNESTYLERLENLKTRFQDVDYSPSFKVKKNKPLNVAGLKADGDSDPCTAVTLSGGTLDGSSCVIGDNSGAAGGAWGGPIGCSNSEFSEIYFKFTATQASLDITISQSGNWLQEMIGGGPEIAIMQPDGGLCSDLNWTTYYTSCPTFGAAVSFLDALTIGEEYYIFVDSEDNIDAGRFELCVNNYLYVPPLPAAGGDCSSATVLTGNLPYSGSGATAAAQLDVWTNNCLFGDGVGAFNMYDTWYEYTSAGDEYINFSLSNVTPTTLGYVNEDFYATVSMIEATCPLPAANGIEDICHNGSDMTADGGEQNSSGSVFYRWYSPGTDFIPDCKTLYIENPGTYYFVVEGMQFACLGFPSCTWTPVGSELTSFDLDVSVMAQGPNDECGDPDSLFLNLTESGNNAGCNYSWDEEDPNSDAMCATTTENTAWFQFCTDPSSTSVDIEFANVTGSIQWGVVEGTCGGVMTSAGTNASNPGIYAPGVNGGIGLSGAGDPCYVGNTDHTITITGLSVNSCYWLVVDGSSGTNSSFDVTIIGGATLGLDFLNVKGEQIKSSNVITWGSENNENTDRFEILRSVDGGSSFDFIASEKPSNFNTSQYVFTDDEIKLGNSYVYVVKRVDVNGETFVSKQIVIKTSMNINNLDKVRVDGAGYLMFDLSSSLPASSKIEIYDMSGKVVFDKFESVEEGVNSKMFNLSSLNKGTYLLFITTNEERLYQKFIK